ncbi:MULTISPECIES: hypothetical protein [Bradyrhizobium]|uniref:hypothetical protein n=1 Tax=Bradyrhizobium elkanii TaxID=29448 RepID=UPI0012BB4C6D|nr:hypothetical protein [Bradyrhizobium elkanii]
MLGPMWIRKTRALVIATFTLAGAAVLLIAMAAPQPTSVAALGSEWQCTKTVFVLTTCRPAEPMRVSGVTQ